MCFLFARLSRRRNKDVLWDLPTLGVVPPSPRFEQSSTLFAPETAHNIHDSFNTSFHPHPLKASSQAIGMARLSAFGSLEYFRQAKTERTLRYMGFLRETQSKYCLDTDSSFNANDSISMTNFFSAINQNYLHCNGNIMYMQHCCALIALIYATQIQFLLTPI